MLFNSLDFAVFLPIVFIIYWAVPRKNIKQQNLVLIAASCVFYSWWDWRFLALILISALTDYIVGLRISKSNSTKNRKIFLWVSIVVNVGLLGVFKYYDFFIENFVSVFFLFGTELNPRTLNIVLPVGISFYTFQTLSYTIDVYRRKIKPKKDFITYATFVCFFPQLVAGPIERARNLIPQLSTPRSPNYLMFTNGLRQILWGLFQKIVIADTCARYVDLTFNAPSDYSGASLALGAVLFAVQIYGDFAGYSNIAIGTGRLFGIKLMQNFKNPYFSRDIAEFWRRWHISLSTWFRDYLYIPIGGNRGGIIKTVRNVFIIFIISGLWHGASWNFIVWGVVNALLFIPLIVANKHKKYNNNVAWNSLVPSLTEAFNILKTFSLVCFAFIFFRADSLNITRAYFEGMLSMSFFSFPALVSYKVILLILMFFIIEWVGRNGEFAIEKIVMKQKWYYRYLFYYGLIFLIFLFAGEEYNFIYFQF